MHRDDLVAQLTAIREEDGLERLAELCTRILESYHQRGGFLHDPEFAACVECGAERELPSNGWDRQVSQLGDVCKPCRQEQRRRAE